MSTALTSNTTELSGAARLRPSFPPLSELVELGRSEYEREFIACEYSVGLDYYLRRLDQMMFAGRRVLDAGCGAGQWALALAQRFEHVDAVDLKNDRIDVLRHVATASGVNNLTTQEASIERLPFGDGTFDAVFCYGVIMFTDVRQTLAEFRRVLSPGGRLYVCLNADGWSRHLIDVRGRTEPRVAEIGQSTLYKTYWHRAVEEGLFEGGCVPSDDGSPASRWLRPPTWLHLAARSLGVQRTYRKSAAWRRLEDTVRSRLSPAFRQRLEVDAANIGDAADVVRMFGVDRAYKPHEFGQRLADAGFVGYYWAPEATLICDWLVDRPVPKYVGHHAGELSVWECMAQTSNLGVYSVDPARHLRMAAAAAVTPAFEESTTPTFIACGYEDVVGDRLTTEARRRATLAGGEKYIAKLAKTIVKDATSDEAAFLAILRFSQRALFRDPIVQPLVNGGIPDAATTLFAARGRCGHAARLVTELCLAAGISARTVQLDRHVIAEAQVGKRWVIADADAFKNGVVPRNRCGDLISISDLQTDPFQLDRFAATGWYIRPGSPYTHGVYGTPVRGYVDALEPDVRGFVSGYYVERARGFPPSLPRITKFERCGDAFRLAWTPSTITDGDRLVGYRIRVGTRSRLWRYDDLPHDERLLTETSAEVVKCLSVETNYEGLWPTDATRLFASITPVSSRVEREPETFFRPSDEASCDA